MSVAKICATNSLVTSSCKSLRSVETVICILLIALLLHETICSCVEWSGVHCTPFTKLVGVSAKKCECDNKHVISALASNLFTMKTKIMCGDQNET